jgi:hypothetical protein
MRDHTGMPSGRGFRVVLVRPPGYVHASALAEAVDYLVAVLTACGRAADHADNALDLQRTNIIACAHLLPGNVLDALPADTILFNAEPIAVDDEWAATPAAYRAALARFHVWDYATANLARLGHDRADVIPFWYRRELARAGAWLAGDRLVFYGVLTPRRIALLDALRRRGVAVDVRFGVYGAERDRAMLGARAVLNLRKRDAPGPFEAIRCFYPLCHGVPVISEDPGDDAAARPLRDAIAFVAGDFVEGVARLVADPAALAARAQAGARAFAALDPVPVVAAAVDRYLSCRSTSTRR